MCSVCRQSAFSCLDMQLSMLVGDLCLLLFEIPAVICHMQMIEEVSFLVVRVPSNTMGSPADTSRRSSQGGAHSKESTQRKGKHEAHHVASKARLQGLPRFSKDVSVVATGGHHKGKRVTHRAGTLVSVCFHFARFVCHRSLKPAPSSFARCPFMSPCFLMTVLFWPHGGHCSCLTFLLLPAACVDMPCGWQTLLTTQCHSRKDITDHGLRWFSSCAAGRNDQSALLHKGAACAACDGPQGIPGRCHPGLNKCLEEWGAQTHTSCPDQPEKHVSNPGCIAGMLHALL